MSHLVCWGTILCLLILIERLSYNINFLEEVPFFFGSLRLMLVKNCPSGLKTFFAYD